MTSGTERSTAWPTWTDVLAFCGSTVLFLYLGVIVFSALLGVSRVPEEQTMFRYGGTAVLVWLLIFGTISFAIGVFFARRLMRTRSRWLAAVVGGLYSFVFVGLSMSTPMRPGSLGAIILVAFMLLFPAIALFTGALKLKRSNPPLQSDRPQASGG